MNNNNKRKKILITKITDIVSIYPLPYWSPNLHFVTLSLKFVNKHYLFPS